MRLNEFRKAQALYMDLSFPPILGCGPNGAIIHYRPEKDSSATMDADKVILLDSGGQYLDGTTDITRTFHFKTPTQEEMTAFTLVLKGHIAIDTAVFPKDTVGGSLDILARQFLWQHGLNYQHGTGHGVGHFLNVHEGPQRISSKSDDVPLKAGMTLSNEPGYYKDGAFGIRLEDVVYVKEHPSHSGFLCFQNVTRVSVLGRVAWYFC